MSYLQAALKVESQNKINRPANIRLVEKKATPITKGRQESLEAILESVIAQALDEIVTACNGKQFRSSDKIIQAEGNVTVIYKKVLGGESTLDEFKNAVGQWEAFSITENTIKQIKKIKQ